MSVTPEVKRIKNGWHAGSRQLNITVRGETPEEAQRLFSEAVAKAAELRLRDHAQTNEEHRHDD